LKQHPQQITAESEEHGMTERDHTGEAEHEIVAHDEHRQREDLDADRHPEDRLPTHDVAFATLYTKGA
jgi:hypothetical protein